jgi:toxin ParE1/3/4
MSRHTVEVLERAVIEMREIYDYIRCDNPTAARKVYGEIEQAIADLCNFPYKGSSVDETDRAVRDYKFIVVYPYLVFYRLAGERIIVYHVLDGRRDYIKILKKTDSGSRAD